MTEPANRRQWLFQLPFFKGRQPSTSATSSEPALGKKDILEGIYDKLILGVIGGLVATLITNYITRQSHFDEVVSKYTAAVKEYTVSEKLSSLRASKENLEKKINALDSFIVKLSDPTKLDLKYEELDGYVFGRSKREVVDSEYINYGVDPHNFSDFIDCANGNSEKCKTFKLNETETKNIQPPQARQSLKTVLENIKDRKKTSLEETEQAINQIRGLAQSVTVNTLITLSEDSSFLGIAGLSNSAMDFIPFFRNKNLVRRDIVINTLRNSELGFGNRYNGESKFPYFLQNITIGSYTTQGGSLINLRQADLSLSQLQHSKLTQLDLTDSVLSNANLTGAVINGADLTRANLSQGILETTTLSNSNLQDAIMKGAILKGSRFTTTERGSCLKFEEDSGKKCYEGVNLKGANLSAADLTNADLTGVDLTGANLTAAILTGAKGVDLDKLKKDSILCNTLLPNDTSYSNNCRNVDLSNSGLKDKRIFKDSHLKSVDFSGSKLAGVKFEGVTFDGSPTFRNTDLTRVDFSTSKGIDATQILSRLILSLFPRETGNNKICYTKITLDKEKNPLSPGLSFGFLIYDVRRLQSEKKEKYVILTMDCSKADLSNPTNPKDNQSLEVDFSGFDLTGIDFSEANLTNVNFREAKLQGAKFNGANLTNADLTKAIDVPDRLSEQAVLCNTTLTDGTKKSTNCKDADLSRQKLTGQSFENVDLTNAILVNADLTGAKGITNDSLAKAKLCNTTLPDGKPKSTNCQGADLSGQDLTGQSFENVDLTGANLTGATGIDAKKLKSAKAILCRTKLPDGSQDDSGCPEKSG